MAVKFITQFTGKRLTVAEEKIKNFSSGGGSIDLFMAILTGGNSTTN